VATRRSLSVCSDSLIGAKWIRTAGPAGFSSKSGVLCQFRFLRRRWPALMEKNGTDRKWPLSLEQAGTGGSNPLCSTKQSSKLNQFRAQSGFLGPLACRNLCTVITDSRRPTLVAGLGSWRRKDRSSDRKSLRLPPASSLGCRGSAGGRDGGVISGWRNG
jgi:hypothetical protein